MNYCGWLSQRGRLRSTAMQLTLFLLACLKQVNSKQLLGILPEAG
jgi:hypothetical protein